MMQRRHRIHEVSHVSRAGNKRFVEDLNSRARMSDGNNPAPLFQLPRELDAAFDLRSNRHHVHRRGVVQHWQTIERVMIGEAAKVLRAQSATLRRVYKGTFIMHAQNPRAASGSHRGFYGSDGALVIGFRRRHQRRLPCRHTLSCKKF